MRRYIAVVLVLLALPGCQNAMDILAGATHAKGTIHVEGYFTDTQGEVEICKAPADDYDYCKQDSE